MAETIYLLSKGTRDRVLGALAKLNLEKPWDLVLKPYSNRRSTSQNSRLWLLHEKASEVTGYTPDELHELALSRYFGTKEVKVGGQYIQVPRKRSSARDIKEFADFMTATEEFYISELGVWLE